MVIGLLSLREKKQAVGILGLVTFMALLEAAGIASVMPFLALLANPDLLESNKSLVWLYNQLSAYGVDSVDGFLVFLGAGAFLLVVVTALYRAATHYVMNRFVEMRRHSISVKLLSAYLRQPYSFFLAKNSGDLSKSVLSEVDELIGSVIRPVYNMLAYTVVLLAITSLLIFVNPMLAILAGLVLGGLYSLAFLTLKNRLARVGESRVVANKDRFVAAGEAFGGIKDIKLLNLEQSYLDRFGRPSKVFARARATHTTLIQVPNFLLEAIVFGTMLIVTLVLVITSGGVHSDSLGKVLPILGLYAFAAYRMKPAIQNLYVGLSSLRYGQRAVQNIYNDIKLIPAISAESDPVRLDLRRELRLEDVTFSYPGSSVQSVGALDLSIRAGTVTGIVGKTGAGKTTIVDLILGLLTPSSGQIIVDGNALNPANVMQWQKNVGYVPQDIFLADTTIQMNIAFGLAQDQVDPDRVETCARLAQVATFIEQKLPNGYQTMVGERGVRLSGGERQRIGIARALYHNPQVLIFDEATSALDVDTERAVMDAIETLSVQKTIVLIAHRLSTVKQCDQVVRVEKGMIRSIGRYEEVMNAE